MATMKTPYLLTRLAVVLLCLSSVALRGQSTDSSKAVADGEGLSIDLASVEQAAQEQFENLKLEELQFEAQMKKKRHEVLQRTLETMVTNQLVEDEATSRGIPRQQLVNEIRASAATVSDEEIEQFWTENQKRLKGTKEDLIPQIKRYLTQQKQGGVWDEFVDQLKAKRNVQFHLEPVRFEVNSEGFPVKGGENAPVTIVEFSDFECPYCSKVNATLEQVSENYGDKVRIVFRQYPLTSIHPNAQKAAEASLCAGEQGHFWPVHDWLFQNQKSLAVTEIQKAVSGMGVEMDTFNECLKSGKYSAGIQMDVAAGMKVGVSGTPAIFVNGRPLSGAVAYETIAAIIDEELAGKD